MTSAMTLPGNGGLREYGKRGSPRAAPVKPKLAKAATKVPDDPGVWSYEPKWDGFLT